MIFTRTPISGAVVIDLERQNDERGFFARSWCTREFADAGLASNIVQSSVSWNDRQYTLRGIHWQVAPYAESKVVRCTAGAIFDVIVDLRQDSPTYLQYFAIRLDADNRKSLFVPAGLGHGFMTLTDGTEVLYHMDAFFAPAATRVARWDDPVFGIEWPASPSVVSHRDRTYPDFVPTTGADGGP